MFVPACRLTFPDAVPVFIAAVVTIDPPAVSVIWAAAVMPTFPPTVVMAPATTTSPLVVVRLALPEWVFILLLLTVRVPPAVISNAPPPVLLPLTDTLPVFVRFTSLAVLLVALIVLTAVVSVSAEPIPFLALIVRVVPVTFVVALAFPITAPLVAVIPTVPAEVNAPAAAKVTSALPVSWTLATLVGLIPESSVIPPVVPEPTVNVPVLIT